MRSTDRSVEGVRALSDRQAAIYEAAVRLFDERGYHGTSVQDVADAAGIQKPTLYHYIGGKEELLFRIARTAVGAYLDDLREVREAGGASGRDVLQALIARHVRRVADDGPVITILLREAHALEGSRRQEILDLTSRYTHGLTDVVLEGVADGSLVTADPQASALGVLGALNWVHRWYRPGGRLDPETIAARFGELFLDGLAPRPAPGPRGDSALDEGGVSAATA